MLTHTAKPKPQVKTCIMYYPCRQQPYTVWFQGKVIAFTETEAEALAQLADESTRGKEDQ